MDRVHGGWGILVIAIVNSIVGGYMWNPAAEGQWQILGWAAPGVVTLTLSVVIMKLRKGLE